MERMKTCIVLLLFSAGVTTAAAVNEEFDRLTFNEDTDKFWPDQPGLWFKNTQKKLTNELISGLGKGNLNDIADILFYPPAMKYDAVKVRLIAHQISLNGDSVLDWLLRLFTGMVLGDQRPSDLLQRMRTLAKYSGVNIDEGTLRQMWMNKLGRKICVALIIRESISECPLEDLAEIADKLMEFNSIKNQLQYIQGHMKPSELRASMQTLDSDTPDAFIHRTLIKVFPSIVGTTIVVWESMSNESTLEDLAKLADRTILMKEETDRNIRNFQELINIDQYQYSNEGHNPSTILQQMRSLTDNMTSLHIWFYYLPEYIQEAFIVMQICNASSTIQDLTELADKLHNEVGTTD